MPKNTDSGPSITPMDAPNARPSEEAYNDAMSRHGTALFTHEDAALVERYRVVRAEDDIKREEEERQRVERGEDPSSDLSPRQRAERKEAEERERIENEERERVGRGEDPSSVLLAGERDATKGDHLKGDPSVAFMDNGDGGKGDASSDGNNSSSTGGKHASGHKSHK